MKNINSIKTKAPDSNVKVLNYLFQAHSSKMREGALSFHSKLVGIKGFTLIELVVAITIIGLLSTIILGSLRTSRERGANSAIKQNLNSLRSEVELLYSNAVNPTYTGVCTDATVLKIREAADMVSGSTMVCYSTATTWAASSALKGPEGSYNYWCVDTSGAARGHTSPLGVNVTVCPTS